MSQTTQLFVERESGSVVLRSPVLVRANNWETTQEIVGRLLAANCVDSVLLDRSRGMATVRFTPHQEESDQNQIAAETLKEIAGCLRDETSSIPRISDTYASCRQMCFQKTQAGLSAATIVHAMRGRIRLRHPLVRRNPVLARRVESSLALIPGVHSVSVSATTGSVVVRYDHQTELAKMLPAALEQVVCLRYDNANLQAGPSAIRWIASGTCLTLATASAFAVPGLAPVTAAALLGFNLPTMGRGVVELCTARWGISALYTVIMGTTLISGQLLAAALMQASITCWHGWSSHRLRKLIVQLRSDADLMFLPSNGQRYEADKDERTEDTRLGNVLTITPGMTLPCDGIVVDGEGNLDERCVRGIDMIAHRTAGEQVFAGSALLQGKMRVHVTAIGQNTRQAKVCRTVLASIEGLPAATGPTERSESTGARFVPYTFAAGTAALAVGDITTLAAVLRPDFTTGPSLSERFGTLSQIGHLLHRGWLVKNAETLHRLARTDAVVIMRSRAAASSERKRPRRDKTESSPSGQLRLNRLTLLSRTIDIHDIESDESSCVDYMRQLRSAHRHVVVVGNGSLLRQIADDDVVRVSLTPDDSFGERTADLVALHADPQNVEDLLRVLHESSRPTGQAWAAVVACNALAISGAFLVGLTSLHVVVLTNIGALAAGALYNRHFQRAGRMLSSRVSQDRPYEWKEITSDFKLRIAGSYEETRPQIPHLESETNQPAESTARGRSPVKSRLLPKVKDMTFDNIDHDTKARQASTAGATSLTDRYLIESKAR